MKLIDLDIICSYKLKMIPILKENHLTVWCLNEVKYFNFTEVISLKLNMQIIELCIFEANMYNNNI